MMKVYPEAYSNELKRLLPDSDAPLPDPDNEYYTLRTKEGRLLAAGVVWKSRLHPRRFRFYIGVEELYRRRGYGTMIFERMRADHPDEKWQGSVDLDNDVAEWWLRGLGFEFSHRCYWMDSMCADLEDTEQYNLPLIPYRHMNQELRDRMVSMIWTDYVRKHEKFDPIREDMDAETFRLIALHEIDPDVTCCLMDENGIAAYAVGASMDDWTASVQFVGSRLTDPEMFRRFLVEFANRAFELKGGLMMDADSFDEDAVRLMHLFGELPEDSYDTYILE